MTDLDLADLRDQFDFGDPLYTTGITHDVVGSLLAIAERALDREALIQTLCAEGVSPSPSVPSGRLFTRDEPEVEHAADALIRYFRGGDDD